MNANIMIHNTQRKRDQEVAVTKIGNVWLADGVTVIDGSIVGTHHWTEGTPLSTRSWNLSEIVDKASKLPAPLLIYATESGFVNKRPTLFLRIGIEESRTDWTNSQTAG